MHHQARKRFGQNFLRDPHVIGRIVSAIAPEKRSNLIEIGPGLGALTQPLMKAAKNLTVIEIDRDLAALLHQEESEHFHVIEGDVLQVNFRDLAEGVPLTIVGNLPYNISTPLIFHLFQFSDVIDEMFFMLQKEVVERMAAQPNTKDYGRLSVMTQYFCEVVPLFSVPPHAFSPQPKVESMVVKLKPWVTSPYPPVSDYQRFAHIVQQAFGQRRKTLRNALSKTDAHLPPELLSKRAEALSVSDFISL